MTVRPTLWPERVEFSAGFTLLVARGLLGSEVRYSRDRITRPCRKALLALMRLGLKPRFRPAALSLTASGTLRPHEIHGLLDQLVDQEFGRSLADEPIQFQKAVCSYLTRTLRHRLHYLSLAQAWIGAHPGASHEFILDRHPVNAPLIIYLRSKGHEASQIFSATEALKLILIPIRDILLGFFSPQADPKTAGDALPGRPALWIEHENLLLKKSWSTLFWRDFVEPRGFDIVCYFDRSDSLTTPEEHARIRGRGLLQLDCRAPHRLARLSLADFSALARQALSVDFSKPWWLHFFRLRYAAKRRLYRALYEKYCVKALIQHQEADWTPNAQADALKETGGIMIGFHWSSYPQYNLNTHSHPQHAYFVWGRFMREALEKKGCESRRILPSGLWILPDNPPNPSLSRLKSGLDFVLAVFDSGTGLEAHHSPSQLSAFYIELAGLLKAHPAWGILHKGKYGWSVLSSGQYGSGISGLSALPRGREIVSRLSPFVADGRFVFLDSLVSSATVVHRADMTVCFGLNTPGIIAGILGRRAVHWDCAGYLCHPIYSDPRQKILYHDIALLGEAVEAAAAGDATIGDFTAWRKLFDEFGDDQGPRRVGTFIQDYLENVLKIGDSQQALDRAMAAYIKTNRVEADFYKLSDIWSSPQVLGTSTRASFWKAGERSRSSS